MNDNSFKQLARRLHDLERQNRSLKRRLFAFPLSALALLALGAALPGAAQTDADGTFDLVQANRFVISDSDGRKRMTLELVAGEPAISMYNHDGLRQVFLGIDENWQDTAYLSVSSRLENGDVDKQAVVAATTSHPQLPGNSQLILYDANPAQKAAARRHLIRLSSGQQNRLPFLEIRKIASRGEDHVNYEVLQASPDETGILLDTNSHPASLSGVHVSVNN